MLYLITGQIGASKTLNTIKMVNEDGAFKNGSSAESVGLKSAH